MEMEAEKTSPSLEEAVAKIQAGRYEEALEYLRLLIKNESTALDARGIRAWLHRSMGRLEEALSDYDALLGRRPEDIEALFRRAETYYLLGRANEAAQGAAAVLSRDCHHSQALQLLLKCHRDFGRNDAPCLQRPVSASYLARGLAGDSETSSCRIPRFLLPSIIRGTLRFPSRYDYYEDFIRRHAAGRRFLDIGGMWLVNGRFSFFAEEAGAAEVSLLDVLPDSREFQEEKQRRNSKVNFLQMDMLDSAFVDQVGQYDVVFYSGVLYHLPDPVDGLARIRAVTKHKAMVGTATIGEGFSKNRAVYYPYLPTFWRRFSNYRSPHSKAALDSPYQPRETYANWFWGMSPSCVKSLLHTVGFRVDAIHYRRGFTFFECGSV